jgi:phosphoribosylanthranilate isomerase
MPEKDKFPGMEPAKPVRVKVCGITRSADSEALDTLGIDFLGFNFHPGSKRFIDPHAAAGIIRRLRKAVPVGVFVDATPAHITQVAAQTGIRYVQLHGREGWDVLDAMALPVIKAVPHHGLAGYGGLKDAWDGQERKPAYFLVDSQSGSEFGGSGKSFDWSLLAEHPLPRPFFLAGGLGPDNVAEAVAATRPYAVDLNSKVETLPGIKDLAQVETCLRALHSSGF